MPKYLMCTYVDSECMALALAFARSLFVFLTSFSFVGLPLFSSHPYLHLTCSHHSLRQRFSGKKILRHSH